MMGINTHSQPAGEQDNPHGPGGQGGGGENGGMGDSRSMYLRFGAMIVTAMFVMYWVMFVGTYALDHVTFSEAACTWHSPWAGPWGW